LITPPLALVLVGAVVLNVMVLPLTVSLSPLPKLEVSELVPAAPDKDVAPSIGSGAVAWLSIAVPEVLAVPVVAVEAERVTGALKPSAAKADEGEPVTERLVPALSFSVTTPPLLTVDGVVVPEIASIAESTSLMLLLPMSIDSVPAVAEPVVVPVVLNEIVLPLTVRVSPAAKPEASEFVPVAPDNSVEPLAGTGPVAWLLAAVPVAVVSVSKKLSPAAIADEATSVVLAIFWTDDVKAVFRFAAVAVGELPIVKLPAGGGFVVVAVS
jgi:hypothetical protein